MNSNNIPDSQKWSLPDRLTYTFKNVPMDDPRVWYLFQTGDVRGLFQLESPLGCQWSKRIKPSNIDELAALFSLMRPGGLLSGMTERYAKIKNGELEPSYIHDSLIPILKDTHSVMTFQEQQLRMCMEIAGLTEVQAETARKAIGKKLPEEMFKVKTMFIEGCKKKGVVPEDIANEIFGWIQKSVQYLFNAGHAYSSAYMSYFQAYQKKYFSTEFYTSALMFSNEKIDPKEEIRELVQDARMHNIKILPPDIQRKNKDFEIIKDGVISFGLNHIKGIGAVSFENLQKPSVKIADFREFVKSTKTIKRNICESLIKSGACDCYNLSRSQMLRILNVAYGRGLKEILPEFKSLTPNELHYFLENWDSTNEVGILTKIIEEEICVAKRVYIIQSKIKYITDNQSNNNDTFKTRAIWEKLYLGIALTCSAADDIEKIEKNVNLCKDVYKLKNGNDIIIHVVIDQIKRLKTGEKAKNPGQEYCYLTVSDNTGCLSTLVCWPEMYEKVKDKLSEDVVCCIYAKKGGWKGRDQLVVNKIEVLG